MSEHNTEPNASEGQTESNNEQARHETTTDTNDKKTFVETVEVAGNQLVDKVKELINQGNARRVVIRDSEGKELIALPLTVGVVGGGVLAVAATPAAVILAAVGTVAAFVTKVKLEIELTEEEDKEPVAELSDGDS